MSKLFSKIELHSLSMFETIRLYKLKIAVKEESVRLNQLIFDGSLDIENIITAEDTFHQIGKEVS
jgi:hypothetical protein